MFIDNEILDKYHACETGRAWFNRVFPDGAELSDVIKHRHVTPQMLHWGYSCFPVSKEEKELYWAKLKIDCEDNTIIYRSDNVKNSKYVVRGSVVEDSEYVFSCKNVFRSDSIVSSNFVEDSTAVYESEFVYSSECVLRSQNITNSRNVINSDYVVDSRCIYTAAGVTSSAFVHDLRPGATKQIRESYFITNCTNLHRCLFCSNINNEELMLFNQKITQQDYDIISRQLKSILKDWETRSIKDEEWPMDQISLEAPAIQHNISKHFADLPEQFWRWVKTLPGYDPKILYALTFQPDLLNQ